MKKNDFFKILNYVGVECDESTLRWFEGIALFYALHKDECDEIINAFCFYDDYEDEEV